MDDLDYLMSMYPSGVKMIQQYVSEACDRMEYQNSPIYDQYPEGIMIDRMCDSICGSIMAERTMDIQSLWQKEENWPRENELEWLKREEKRLGVETEPGENQPEGEGQEEENEKDSVQTQEIIGFGRYPMRPGRPPQGRLRVRGCRQVRDRPRVRGCRQVRGRLRVRGCRQARDRLKARDGGRHPGPRGRAVPVRVEIPFIHRI